MSMINVCTMDINRQHHRMSTLYRRFNYQTSNSTNDSLSTTTSLSSSSSSFEVIFSRLLDALIFTSAIAITAYSYLTGTLLVNTTPNNNIEAPPTAGSHSPSLLHHHRHHHHHLYTNKKNPQEQDPLMEDAKRKRTQAWAEQQIIAPQVKKRSCSTSHHFLDSSKRSVSSRDHMKRERKRTQSLPVNKVGKEDEVLSRMEERLKSMIQEGQEALSSPVKYDDPTL